jgi:hyperosmotically inducible periplasmic protein
MKRIRFLSILVAIAAFGFAGCTTTQAPEQQVKDAKITTEVKSKLATEVRAETLTNISVNTTNGVVTLAGTASTEEVKTNAELIAKGVMGVRQVNNKIQVQPVQGALPPPAGERGSGS